MIRVEVPLIVDVEGGTTTPVKVTSGTIGAGYDGVIVSIASEQDDDVILWIKKQEKQVIENGLNSGALPTNFKECPVFIGILEKQKWELGLTNLAVGDKAINWLIRIRLFRREV